MLKWQVGDVTVTRILELEATSTPEFATYEGASSVRSS